MPENNEKPKVNNNINKDNNRLRNKEHKADALAIGAEEGRGKLRKAAVRCKQPATRRCPNGETRVW